MPRKTHDFPEFIGLKVPEQLAQDARRAAARNNQTLSGFVRSAVEQAIDRLASRGISPPEKRG